MVSHPTDLNSPPSFMPKPATANKSGGDPQRTENGKEGTVSGFQKMYDENVQSDAPVPRKARREQSQADSSNSGNQQSTETKAEEKAPSKDAGPKTEKELPKQASSHAASVLETLQYVEPAQRHEVSTLGKARAAANAKHGKKVEGDVDLTASGENEGSKKVVFGHEKKELSPADLQQEIARAKARTEHPVEVPNQDSQKTAVLKKKTIPTVLPPQVKTGDKTFGDETIMVDRSKEPQVPDWVVRPEPKPVESSAPKPVPVKVAKEVIEKGEVEVNPKVAMKGKPQVIIKEEAEVVAEKGPEVVAEKRPKFVTEKRPEVVAQNRPKVVAEKRPEVVAQNRPKVVTEKRPEVVAQNRPKVVAEKRPEVVAENRPMVVTEKRPEVVAENRPKVVAEKRPEVVAENRPKVVAEKRPEVVAENRPKVVAETRPVVVAEKRPAVASSAAGIASESEEVIIARPKREVQAEAGEPQAPAADDMMSTMPLDRAKVKQSIFGTSSELTNEPVIPANPKEPVVSMDELLKGTPDATLKSIDLEKSENVGWPDAQLPTPNDQVAKEIELLQNLEKQSGPRPSPFSAKPVEQGPQSADPLARVPHDKLPEQALANAPRRPGQTMKADAADAKLTGFKTVITTREEVAHGRAQQKTQSADLPQARPAKANPRAEIPVAETRSGITPETKNIEVTSTINLPRGVDVLKRAQAALKRGQTQKAKPFDAQVKERQGGEGMQESPQSLNKAQATVLPNQATRAGNISDIIRFINENVQHLRGAENTQNTKMVLDFSSNRFGNLNITIEQSSGQLNVTLQSDTDSSRQQLLDQRDELARQLRQMGYGEVSVDIEDKDQDAQKKQAAEDEDDSPDKNVRFRGEDGNILEDLG
ncbi:hypothetical protein BVY04_02415 [bacterium M21]|nr:hypothetical protein BVY04_02415 [bacterium M21]